MNTDQKNSVFGQFLRSDYKIIFDKAKLKLITNHLLDIVAFLWNSIFKQVIGIPMVSDLAPFKTIFFFITWKENGSELTEIKSA